MPRVYLIKPCLSHHHEAKGELANKYMEGGCIFLRDRSFPEGIGRVPALIDDHAVHHTQEDHELGVDFDHLLEVLIVEVQVVVDFLFGEDVLLYLLPVHEAEPLFIFEVQTFGDKLVDTAVFILRVGNLVLS